MMTRIHPSSIEPLESRTLLSSAAGAIVTPPVSSSTNAHAVQSTPSTAIKTVAGPTLNLTAGVPFAGTVGFYASPVLDPPMGYRASINWGDGTTSNGGLSYGMSGNTFGVIISGLHTYTQAGTYSVTTTFSIGPISPKSGLPTTILEKIVDKAIVAPGANSSGGVTIKETEGKKFTADVGTFITIAPATGLSATIIWGDGTTSKGVLTSVGIIGIDEIKFKVTGTHAYAEEGKNAIHILVTRQLVALPGQPAPDVVAVVATLDSTAIVTEPVGESDSLAGTITGTYQNLPSNPDAPRIYAFSGTGSAGDLGQVTVSGQVQLVGFIASGRAGGTLTLKNAKGSVTLQLTGPVEPGFGPFPQTLSYVITGGTGAYADEDGSGTLGVKLTDTSTAALGGGRFTFVIQSNAD